MSYWGRDWRSPGDEWLKENDGRWVKAKLCRQHLMESLNESYLHRIIRRSINEDESSVNEYKQYCSEFHGHQPQLYIKTVTTKEGGPITLLSEAMSELNFKNGLKDPRRFAYICKILQILTRDKLHLVSGRTQIFLLDLFEEAVRQVAKSGNNIKIVRDLLADFKESLKRYKYQHIGSDRLWQNHMNRLQEMEKTMEALSSNVNAPTSAGPKLTQLPPECLQRILSYLSAPDDFRTAGDACAPLQHLVEDELLWRQLVLFNFSGPQIQAVLPWRTRSIDDCSSREIYRRLFAKYGDRCFFLGRLYLCEVCKCIFWPVLGHSCISREQDAEKPIRDLSPADFLAFFKF